MNFRNTLFIIITLLFIFFMISMKQESAAESSGEKPTIAASTFSLYEITKHIVADTANTLMVLPLGVDAHSYEPSPKQIARLYRSDLLVYSGAGLEPWIENFEFRNRAIDMSLHVKLKELGEDEHKHQSQSTLDPHYWLDFSNMIRATEYITKELIELFPLHKEFYTKNRDSYIEMLKNLDKEYTEKLSSCKLDTIVVNHNAFSYLSSRYGFHVEAMSGLSSEAEPSAKRVAGLIEYIKKYKLSTIFFESFASDKAIKSIAHEVNVAVDTLQPLGNITADEAKLNLSYEDIMRSNLEKISRALECR